MKKIFCIFLILPFLYSCRSLTENNYTKCKEGISYPYWTKWAVGELVSMVDDSLAVLSAYKYKIECDYYEDIAGSREGLFLVNYRVKQKPLRGDTLELEYKMYNTYYHDHGLRILNGYLFRDTSALVFDLKNNKFGFWKIGEKSIEFSEHKIIGNPAFAFGDLVPAKNAGRWANGNIVFFSNPIIYIFDAEKGQIEQFHYELSEEYEWMKNYRCDNLFLSYVGDKVVCADFIYIGGDGTIEGYNLLVDGIPVDTIKFFKVNSGYDMLGNYFRAQDRIFKIDTLNLKFDRNFSLWVDKKPLRFYNDKDSNPDDFVSYSAEDLINFKGEQP